VDRKNFFKSGIKQIAAELYQTPAGALIDNWLQGLSNALAPYAWGAKHGEAPGDAAQSFRKFFPRPPGALPGPADFTAACTNCGDCRDACPHGTLIFLSSDSGPVFNPNFNPCRLCADFPCIAACREGALLALPKRTLPKFGQAFLKNETCLNHPLNRERKKQEGAKRLNYCRRCLNACPVLKAIRFDERRFPEFSGICTGCGMCVMACPTFPKAIEIR